MTFWYGSGDPYLCLTDLDPDPAIFVGDLAHYFFQVYLHNFSKIKEVINIRNQGFSYYFAWWLKDPDPYLWLTDPGGPETYGSRSGFESSKHCFLSLHEVLYFQAPEETSSYVENTQLLKFKFFCIVQLFLRSWIWFRPNLKCGSRYETLEESDIQ